MNIRCNRRWKKQARVNRYANAAVICMYEGRVFACCDNISYSVTREMAPIYMNGTQQSFGRGKRGIAGTIKMSNLSIEQDKAGWPFKIGIHKDGKTIILSGCELINEGDGMEWPEISPGQTCTFVARGVKTCSESES